MYTNKIFRAYQSSFHPWDAIVFFFLTAASCGNKWGAAERPSPATFVHSYSDTVSNTTLAHARVYVLTSWGECPKPKSDALSEESNDSIRHRVESDKKDLLRIFSYLDATYIDPEQLTSEPNASERNAIDNESRVGIVIYSGHGTAIETENGVETALCLNDNRTLYFSDVVRFFLKKKHKALVFILNACGSAYVDPGKEEFKDTPISVISTAIDVMNAVLPFLDTSPFYASNYSSNTTVIESIKNLIRESPGPGAPNTGIISFSETIDRDCDNIITDTEFFTALATDIKARSWNAYAGIKTNSSYFLNHPVLKLRQNAARPIPLFNNNSADSDRCRDLFSMADRARLSFPNLGKMLYDDRINGESSKSLLKSEARDYFYIRNTSATLRFQDCTELPTPESEICTVFSEEMDPLLWSELDTPMADLKFLSKISPLREIYEVRLDAPWIETLRIRDGLILKTGTTDHVRSLVPAKSEVVQNASTTGVMKQFKGHICREKLDRFDAEATPCQSDMGQCFLLRSNPTREEEACDE